MIAVLILCFLVTDIHSISTSMIGKSLAKSICSQTQAFSMSGRIQPAQLSRPTYAKPKECECPMKLFHSTGNLDGEMCNVERLDTCSKSGRQARAKEPWKIVDYIKPTETALKGATEASNALQTEDYVAFALGFAKAIAAFVPVLAPVEQVLGIIQGLFGAGKESSELSQIKQKLHEITETLKKLEEKIDNIQNVVQDEIAKQYFREIRNSIKSLGEVYRFYTKRPTPNERDHFKEQCSKTNYVADLNALYGQLKSSSGGRTIRSARSGELLEVYKKQACNPKTLMNFVRMAIGTFIEGAFLSAACRAVSNKHNVTAEDLESAQEKADAENKKLKEIQESLKKNLLDLFFKNEQLELEKCTEKLVESFGKDQGSGLTLKAWTNELHKQLNTTYSFRKWAVITYSDLNSGFEAHQQKYWAAKQGQDGFAIPFIRKFGKTTLVVTSGYNFRWSGKTSEVEKCIKEGMEKIRCGKWHIVNKCTCTAFLPILEKCAEKVSPKFTLIGCYRNHDGDRPKESILIDSEHVVSVMGEDTITFVVV